MLGLFSMQQFNLDNLIVLASTFDNGLANIFLIVWLVVMLVGFVVLVTVIFCISKNNKTSKLMRRYHRHRLIVCIFGLVEIALMVSTIVVVYHVVAHWIMLVQVVHTILQFIMVLVYMRVAYVRVHTCDTDKTINQ